MYVHGVRLYDVSVNGLECVGDESGQLPLHPGSFLFFVDIEKVVNAVADKKTSGAPPS